MNATAAATNWVVVNMAPMVDNSNAACSTYLKAVLLGGKGCLDGGDELLLVPNVLDRVTDKFWQLLHALVVSAPDRQEECVRAWGKGWGMDGNQARTCAGQRTRRTQC